MVINEVLDLGYQKRQLKQQTYTSTEGGLEYRKVNKELRKKMKAAKEKRIVEQCKNIEKGMRGNSKEAHTILKALTETQQHKSAVIKDSSGNIVTETTAVLSPWTECCSGLYNYDFHPVASLLSRNQKAYLY